MGMWGNLSKIFKVVEILAGPGGATKKEIADVAGTGERQVYRVLESIQNMGIPVYDDRPEGSREKVWCIEESYTRKLPNITIPDPGFTLPELFVLCFIRGAAAIFQNTDISKFVDSSFDKLKGFALENRKDIFERMESVFITRDRLSKNYAGWEDRFMLSLEAILSRKVSLITYHSFRSGAVKEYLVHPLHLFENDGGLYLMVQIKDSGRIYTFAVERIKSIEIKKETFIYPSGFDAGDFLNQSFGIFMDEQVECRIWFSAAVSRYIRERRWAAGQTITENDDGSIVLDMTTYGWADVKRWVLSFGKDACVMLPEKMKKEMAQDIQTMSALYGK
ncbi:transcriptional regulator [Desulfatiferula olefinivorans]